jgi:hypothetical protein
MPPKARTKATAKRKEREQSPAAEVKENAGRLKSVSTELNDKLVGCFKVRTGSVTTTWEGPIQNRLADPAAVDKLVESIRLIGIRRLAPEHYMLGTLESKEIQQMLDAMKMTRAEVQKLNATSEYPDVPAAFLDDENIAIRLEAGQHRFLALEQLYPENDDERWWVIRIFQSPLSNYALDYIRANDRFYMTPLSDGERFLHCFRWYELKEKCLNDDEGMKAKAVYALMKYYD